MKKIYAEYLVLHNYNNNILSECYIIFVKLIINVNVLQSLLIIYTVNKLPVTCMCNKHNKHNPICL